jgi:glycosyltransferase involved in cell wall biosynthesis
VDEQTPQVNRPLRVFHCFAGNLYGGIETMLRTLARYRHLEPELEPEFVACFEGRLTSELRDEGAVVHLAGPVRMSRPWTVLSARRNLRALIAERSPDVVICHAPWSFSVFAPAVRKTGVPLVYWMHDMYSGGDLRERLTARTPPDLVIYNSRCTGEGMLKLFGRPLPSELIHCPVTLTKADNNAEIRRELGTDPAARVIIQVSRMERWKGASLLIDGLARLRDVPNWEAWIVGGAQRPQEQQFVAELQASAQAAGIADHIRFLGQRSDVPKLLAAADIHCQPNLGPEPFGIVFIEALFAGLPVVSTNMGGAAEIVNPSCGVLVPPGDASALAEALRGLIEDPARCEQLGANGPARALELCDPGARLAQLHTALSHLTRRTA